MARCLPLIYTGKRLLTWTHRASAASAPHDRQWTCQRDGRWCLLGRFLRQLGRRSLERRVRFSHQMPKLLRIWKEKLSDNANGEKKILFRWQPIANENNWNGITSFLYEKTFDMNEFQLHASLNGAFSHDSFNEQHRTKCTVLKDSVAQR